MRNVIAALLLALLPLSALAENGKACQIGQFTEIRYDVSVFRNGATMKPLAGEMLCPKDRIRTGAKGIAQLKFQDGTEITVGHDSEFVINQWKQNRMLANKASFELVQGAFRALTGAMTQRRHRFEVKTVIATIGVRGTEFWGGTNISDEALDVIVLNGKGVYVENDAGRVVLDQAGAGTTVRAGKAPGAPEAWSPEKVKKAVATITP